jgi:hypothetical protein
VDVAAAPARFFEAEELISFFVKMKKELGLRKCGDCGHFDTKTVAGKPLGKINMGGMDVDEGYCRVNGGLIFKVLNGEVSCLQPQGVFVPKVNNQTAAQS